MSHGTVTRSRSNNMQHFNGTNLNKKEELVETGNMFNQMGMGTKDFMNMISNNLKGPRA